ncbi:MAG: hypothetical protein MRERV_41c003 [Mycoplasmataceae bacterium RV_VA103A]|nr:MAG: hypothetical protein MRERV_41c003 [Mycoplasmataceae bacterium RV_VA103A]
MGDLTLNNTINQKTGGRSFSVYRLIDFPEKIMELKNNLQPP